MATDRFYIAPFDANSGLQNNVKPFMITDQAFAQMNNAYAWRGRVRKRFGSRWLGNTQQSTRLRVGILDGGGMPVVTDGAGSASGTTPSANGAVGQMFSIADVLFTVNSAGAAQPLLVSNGSATAATFDTTNGNFVFTGVRDSNGALVVGAQVYWYPALPVMGLATFQNAVVNNESTIAFDTRYAYSYSSGWDRISAEATAGAATWTGSNSQFFWTTTWVGVNASDYVLFVTNFNETEPNFMRYLFNNQWQNFEPLINSVTNKYMISARILVPFKNRLLAFNIWEGDADGSNAVQYANRMRFSGPSNASPIDNAGASYFPWNVSTKKNGSGLDCPTEEAIVTVEFVKDRLIVFLEQSTWEIVYTGNQINPFAWQQINTELGVESTFSVVPFDKVAIGVGNVGVMACTGTNVERIDDRIPDEVFNIHNTDAGIDRVYGIRDYFVEMIYWTFPSPITTSTFPYPNKVLVYNYKNGTWSFNNDSITAFGYFQPQPTGILWSSTTVTWSDDETWDDGSFAALFRQVIAGNQEGWTFIVDADVPVNCAALQITDITIAVAGSNQITIKAIDHNIREGDYVFIDGVTGTGNLNLLNGLIFKAIPQNPENANTFLINYQDDLGTIIAGTYSGGGTLARVSRISLQTKQYNFYMQAGRNAYVSKVDFLVDRTENGQIQIDYFVSTGVDGMLADSNSLTGTGSLLGTGILETFPYPSVPFESKASQLWHPCYFQADGEFIQLQIALNDDQMIDPLVRMSQFQLHSMIFHAQQSSYRLQ